MDERCLMSTENFGDFEDVREMIHTFSIRKGVDVRIFFYED
jgi:hypothetical protein